MITGFLSPKLTQSNKTENKQQKEKTKKIKMASKNTHTVPHRRRREGKTNYKKRLRLLTSKKKRLVIRKTNTRIIAQIVDYKPEGDKIITSADSSQLRKFSWQYSGKNTIAAYLVGYLVGKKALKQKVNEAIVDIGLISPIKGSKIYAVVKGAIDAGLKVNAGEVFPSEERIKGKHINFDENIFNKIKSDIDSTHA